MTRTSLHEIHDKKRLNGPMLAFLLGMAGALAIFLPFLIVDKGFYIYSGDYNEQQIPFYMYVNQFIKTGGGTWSWATDIGTSVVNSYSFYNIGSPFLWLSIPIPSVWMPFAMVPLFMLKFGAIAASACLYLSRYAKSRNIAVIISLAYAFCGFNVYNVFFNHMLDPVAIFPLMLWAMDAYIYEKRRGIFALLVGLALINSYFFFIGNVVFLIIYFMVKLALGEYDITMTDFSLLVLEAVIGVGIGMVLALPSFYNLIQNPRTNDFSNGLGLLLYGHVHQYFNIITTMLVPPDPPYMPNLFTEGAIKWTSMSSFIPIFSIAGVAAYVKGSKKTSVKWILGICFVMAMVPILNSSFYAFNSSYYARWFYMPILLMCQATMVSIEDRKMDIKFGAKFALVLTLLYSIFGLLPTKKDENWVIGAAETASKFWLTFLTALLGIVVFYVLVTYYRKSLRFAPALLGAVLAFSVFYSVTHISLGKFPQWENDKNYRSQNYDSAIPLGKMMPEEGFYRIDSYEVTDNIGLWMNKSSIRTFNSVVTPSIMEFNPLVGVKRDVSSKPDRNLFAHRGLMSVKYTVMPKDKTQQFEEATGENEYNGNLGWHHFMDYGELSVYENENFVPLGFTYDKYIWMDHLRMVSEADRSGILMRAIGLDFNQVEDLGHLLVDGEEGTRIEPEDENGEVRFNYDAVDYDRYVKDAADRRANASYETSYDASGFSCKIKLDRENFVFFAVPFDEGFSATVNGEEVAVYNVSGGLMAVVAPEGDNEIIFTYKTPGFHTGILITLLSLAALLVYLILCRMMLRRAKAKAALAQEQVDAHSGISENEIVEMLAEMNEEAELEESLTQAPVLNEPEPRAEELPEQPVEPEEPEETQE